MADEVGHMDSNECEGNESRIGCGRLNPAGVVSVSSVTNDDGTVTRVFTEKESFTNGNMVTEHLIETRMDVSGDGKVLGSKRNESARSYEILAASSSTPSKGFEGRHLVDDVRVEATVKIQACRRIDGGDGFKRLKDECEDTFTRAGAEYELGRWSAAAMAYSNLIVQVEKLERLDEGRKMAAAARIRAESAAKVQTEKAQPSAPTVVQVQLPQPDKEVVRREVKMSALLESAKEYAEKERWKECLATVNAVLELNPNNRDAKQLKWRAQNGIETANSPMFATPQNTLRGGRGANGLEPLNQDMPKDDWRHQQGTKFFK